MFGLLFISGPDVYGLLLLISEPDVQFVIFLSRGLMCTVCYCFI